MQALALMTMPLPDSVKVLLQCLQIPILGHAHREGICSAPLCEHLVQGVSPGGLGAVNALQVVEQPVVLGRAGSVVLVG